MYLQIVAGLYVILINRDLFPVVIDYLIENECTGIDRVVNIVRALDIDVNWDGFDLIRTLSREITL